MNTHRLSANIIGIIAVVAIFLLPMVTSANTTATGNPYGVADKASLSQSNVSSSWMVAQGGRGGSKTGQQKPPPPPHGAQHGPGGAPSHITWPQSTDIPGQINPGVGKGDPGAQLK